MGNNENENVLNTNYISKPGYKYVEVVRGKDERAKLNGYKCRDCQQVFFSELLHFRPPKISPMKVGIPLFPLSVTPPPPPPRTQQTKRLDAGFLLPTSLCSVPSSSPVHFPSFPLLLSCTPLPPGTLQKTQRNEQKKCVTLHIELIEALFLLLVIAIASTIRPQDLYIFKGPSHPNFFSTSPPLGVGPSCPLFLGDSPVHPSS